jgi:hypothetical protein
MVHTMSFMFPLNLIESTHYPTTQASFQFPSVAGGGIFSGSVVAKQILEC